jgi:hypothetical protein
VVEIKEVGNIGFSLSLDFLVIDVNGRRNIIPGTTIAPTTIFCRKNCFTFILTSSRNSAFWAEHFFGVDYLQVQNRIF